MKSPALAIKNLIDTAISGVWSVYVGEKPASEINVISCFDVSGADPIRLMDGDDIWQPLVAINIASYSYPEAYERYDEIRRSLQRVPEFNEDGAHYCGVWLRGDLGHIGKDENDRHQFTITAEIRRKEL